MPTNPTKEPDAIDHVVIVSGGMDSFTLLHEVRDRLNPEDRLFVLSFDYGQRHKRELDCVKHVCALLPSVEHHILPMHFLRDLAGATALTSDEVAVPHGHYAAESMKLTVVPGRNTLMLAAAMSFAQAVSAATPASDAPDRNAVVYFGAHAGDHFIYPDCRPTFIAAMNRVMLVSTEGQVRLSAPFQDMTKSDILEHGLNKLALTAEDYSETWTCYEGGEHPCGKCGSCTERAEAFADNEASDPLIDRAIAAGVLYEAGLIRVGDADPVLDQG